MSDGADRAQTADGVAFPSFADWRTGQLRRERQREVLRWGISFAVVLAVTGGMVLWIMHLPPPVAPVPEPPPAAIAIDLAPEPASTPTPPTDAPVGPQQTVSVPDPEPEPPPRITAPPAPAPNPPLVVPKEEKRKIIKKKTRPTLLQKKPIPDKTPPAEATTAPPSSEAPPAPDQAAPAPGASSSHAAHDPVTWQGALLAQLEKFKRYPAEAQADRQEGTAYLHFTMDRKGHVLSANIETSSGHGLLDQETLALVRRAEPLPIPPDEVQGDPITLTVPVEFYIHPN